MTRPDPTDAELLEFVARFAGWTELTSEAGIVYGVPPSNYKGHCFTMMPGYLNSVDAWLRDVWPKMLFTAALQQKWMDELERLLVNTNATWRCRIANADARSRCLALYRALEGQLP